MFKQIARRPPPRPLRLVLNQVRNPAVATDAAERLISSIEEKLKLPARLAATLPWDPDLATIEEPSALLSMTQPTAALVRAIAPLADDLDGNAETAAPLPVAMVFWEQFQTLLQQPIAEAAAPLELSDPVQPPAAPAPATPAPATAPQTAVAPVQMVSAAPAPELAAQLDRIATSLEQLSKEVARLRSGLAGKFEFEDDEDGEGRREGAGEPIHLDFESFRRARSDGKIKE